MTPMPNSGKEPRSPGERIFRLSMALFGIGALAAALVALVWSWHAGPYAVRQGLDAAKPWLALWRLFLFTVLIGGWRHGNRLLMRWAGRDERHYRFMLAQRWRVAAWLLVFEALVVQGVAGEFILHLIND